MLNSINKLTARLEQVLESSKQRALFFHKKEIEAEDLFWALILAPGSMAHEVLNKTGGRVQNQQEEWLQTNFEQEIEFSNQAKKIIEGSVNLAQEMEHYYVGTEHLLFSLLEKEERELEAVFTKLRLNKKKVKEQLEVVFKSTLGFGEMSSKLGSASERLGANELNEERILEELEKIAAENSELAAGAEWQIRKMDRATLFKSRKDKRNKNSLLNYFAQDLTDEKVQQNIDPVIGRKQEIDRVIQILSRRTKNNPVLLGDPGVGKTAIVEGIAKKIVEQEVPDILLNKKIYSLDVNSLVAGAMMRGEFESRLKQVIDEVKEDPNIILFIDELHNVVGAGSVSGTNDAANILKPALARGELRCIGATTFTEYKKHIEDDAALERRFQPVLVAEPVAEEAIKILQGIRQYYEKHHLVKITDEAIKAAVKLSERYLPEKFLPDKAIDLIDEAAAQVKVKSGVVDEDLRELKLLEAKIEEIQHAKQTEVSAENYNEALRLKDKEVQLYDKFFAVEDKVLNKDLEQKWLGTVGVREVAQVVKEMTGIPLENLVGLSRNKLINIEKKLAERIVGQTEVLNQISFYLKRARAGLAGQNRPLGSFMFLGPSGVGKTETAKVLAEEIFGIPGKKTNLIRFDMSEFGEKFNMSRLIGSPAGYVGFKEGGGLTEAVRRNPFSVVLFDEIEKAHPEIFNVLLQILDEGTLTDATGKKVNFKNTIIVLTSNLGLQEFGAAHLGFGSAGINDNQAKQKFEDFKKFILKEVKDNFRPELLNRLDKIMIFAPLTMRSVEKIVTLELKQLANNLFLNKNIKLEVSTKVINWLAQQAYAPESGARMVRKVVEEKVENELASKILKGEVKNGEELRINLVGQEIRFERITNS